MLRAVNAVPVAGDRTEAVVGANAEIVILLDLLQHRVRLAAGVDIARKQQQRDAVRRSGCRGRDHIGGARPDGGGDGKDALTAVLFGKSRRHMGDALLVAALHHLQMARILFQRLADTQHFAVPKDGGDALHEGGFVAIHADVLLIQEPDQRLGHGHTFGLHKISCQPSVGMENAAPVSCCISGQRAVMVFIRV